MAEYVPQQYHLVPGRLRLKIASVKGNEARARLAEARLREVNGVRDVCANKLTGSLIVRFDPVIVSVAQIFNALATNGLVDAGAVPTFPVAPASAQLVASGAPVADALFNKAVETLLERCALALIAAVV
ncbi:HMA2 domain-containing protein [Paraburkholderia diazotrophica]|uniref:HMA2 domain-containing protein n=1 Tax=Paraburkholderia diazotrophica TaxID=667676 RepID=UPI00317C9BEA